jgi:hypothetical protein
MNEQRLQHRIAEDGASEAESATAERRLIQVVSGFRPDVDGMGDYARHLAEELWRRHGIASEMVVFHRPDNGAETGVGEGWRVRYAEAATGEALVAAVQERMREMPQAHLLLHYGPYAYTGNGRPLHFAEAMAKLGADGRLAVFFHEMWARGWPWKRAFWTQGNQVRAVRALIGASHVGFTSSELFRRWMEPLNGRRTPLEQVRIFSNMGEVERPLPLREREPRLVVFGQRETRLRLYREYRRELEQLCRILGLERIVDAGSGTAAIPERVGAIALERVGFLSEAEASRLLATSVAGVVCYAPVVWEKSGVLATYQAHGMVPVVAARWMQGFRATAETPFALIGQLVRCAAMSADQMQALADRAYVFYQREVALRRAAEKVRGALWRGAATAER